jgi:tetrahydromethanopterin S-methyltransferase subunit D
VIALLESAGHRVGGTPAVPFVAAVIGYGVGGFAGALLAARIAAHRRVAGWTVVAILAALAVSNTFGFAHPGWYVPAALLMLAAAGALAIRGETRA